MEHLLRNVKDATISTLASDVSAKLQALKGLKSRLADVQVCVPSMKGFEHNGAQGPLVIGYHSLDGCV